MLHHLVPPQGNPLPVLEGHVITRRYLIGVVVALLANHTVYSPPEAFKGSEDDLDGKVCQYSNVTEWAPACPE